MNIIIIEDDPSDIEFLKIILEGHELDIFESIPKEISLVNYDLAIVDYFIHGNSSQEYLEYISSLQDKPPAFILASGKLDEININEIPRQLNATILSKNHNFKELLTHQVEVISNQESDLDIDYKTLYLNMIHDLRNDLSFFSYFEQLEKNGKLSEEVKTQFIKKSFESAHFAFKRLEELSTFLNTNTDQYASLKETFETVQNSHLIKDHINAIQITGITDQPINEIPSFFLSTILKNLIENSCKYAQKNKELKVLVHCEMTEESTVINITDNSQGMHKSIAENLFTKKIDSSTGLGVGLVVINRIIESYKGRIVVNSSLGIGTSIRISFSK